MLPGWAKITIIVIVVLIALIVAAVVITNVTKKNTIKKMYKDIEDVLHTIKNADGSDTILTPIVNNAAYDYNLETENYIYYIKVVYNSGNQEICVNNSIKWQLRRHFNDNTLRFVPDIEGLMRLDIPYGEKKGQKLYIIYPNARSLLKYINECEMVFVHPDTDVYGTNLIPYATIKLHPELIKTKFDDDYQPTLL